MRWIALPVIVLGVCVLVPLSHAIFPREAGFRLLFICGSCGLWGGFAGRLVERLFES